MTFFRSSFRFSFLQSILRIDRYKAQNYVLLHLMPSSSHSPVMLTVTCLNVLKESILGKSKQFYTCSMLSDGICGDHLLQHGFST